MSRRPSKRQRTGLPSFGAPSEADSPSSQQNSPSSSASSTRCLGSSTVPALTTLCARVFVANFLKLRKDEAVWKITSQHLRLLPDFLIPRLFAMLRSSWPTYLTHEFIVTFLLRGPSITLRSDLPGVKKGTILDIPRFNAGVQELELSGFGDISDKTFASLLKHLPHLRKLILRGCTKVGAETAHAAAEFCHNLRILNFSYTSVTPLSLVPLMIACPEIEVLKVAGIQNWTDATFANFLAGIGEGRNFPALRTLKLRQTSLSDSSIEALLTLCPALQTLDLSFTLVRHPPTLLSHNRIPALRKLSLTSTAVSGADLISVVSLLPHMRTLAIGALGVNRGLRASVGNSSAMTMNDDTLRSLTAILEQFLLLENLSLVGNTKLGQSTTTARPLANFITRVGRKCKRLNLAGITSLRSSDLAGLASAEADDPSHLESLILNNTGIDDEAGLYIATCPSLRTLEVAGTKFTSEGVFPIIDSCTKLENLDLTSCRGIRVMDRRRFFEVWEEARR